MILESIQAFTLSIPFRQSFKHASAERTRTQSILVVARARDGTMGYGEGCPREYVTAESVQGAKEFTAVHHRDWMANITDIDTLTEWISGHEDAIDRNPAAWTAVELALLDLIGKVKRKPVEALLGLPPLSGSFQYTAVLGDASPHEFEIQLARYLQMGFSCLKIKLSGDPKRDWGKVQALAAANVSPQAVRADANNLWEDATAAHRYLDALGFPFFALEEPLPADDYDGMRRLAVALQTRIILDESLLRVDQLDRIGDHPGGWIVNLRVSKMGGLIRSMALVRELRRRRLPLICGAHVGETSLLTRAGLTAAHGARDILMAQEGAFGTHLLSADVVETPVMFGYGGILDARAPGITGAGLGLPISQRGIASAVVEKSFCEKAGA